MSVPLRLHGTLLVSGASVMVLEILGTRVGAPAHVTPDRGAVNASRRQFAVRPGQVCRVSPVEDDPRPPGCEFAGEGLADPPARAGDDRHLILESPKGHGAMVPCCHTLCKMWPTV